MSVNGGSTIFFVGFDSRLWDRALSSDPKLPQNGKFGEERAWYIADWGKEATLKQEQGREQKRYGPDQLPREAEMRRHTDRLGTLHGLLKQKSMIAGFIYKEVHVLTH